MPTNISTKLIIAASVLAVGVISIVATFSIHSSPIELDQANNSKSASNQAFDDRNLFSETAHSDSLRDAQQKTGVIDADIPTLSDIEPVENTTDKLVSSLIEKSGDGVSVNEDGSTVTLDHEAIRNSLSEKSEEVLQNALPSDSELEEKISIVVTQDNSTQSKQAYLDAFKKLEPLAESITRDIEQMTLSANASTYTTDLRRIVAEYDTLLESIQNVHVPSDWEEYHRRGTLSLIKQREGLAMVLKTSSDPALLPVSMQLFTDGSNEYTQLVQEFRIVLAQEGLI